METKNKLFKVQVTRKTKVITIKVCSSKEEAEKAVAETFKTETLAYNMTHGYRMETTSSTPSKMTAQSAYGIDTIKVEYKEVN